jgi:hypothetical protein
MTVPAHFGRVRTLCRPESGVDDSGRGRQAPPMCVTSGAGTAKDLCTEMPARPSRRCVVRVDILPLQ